MNRVTKISIFVIILLFIVQSVFAEDVRRICFSDNWVDINKTFNSTVQVVASKKVGKCSLKLYYDKRIFSLYMKKIQLKKMQMF